MHEAERSYLRRGVFVEKRLSLGDAVHPKLGIGKVARDAADQRGSLPRPSIPWGLCSSAPMARMTRGV
jgi:hypothetical protein